MVEWQIHDNVDTFDLWLKDSRRKREAIHIVFEHGVTYDVSPAFIMRWLPTQKVKVTEEEALQLSDELKAHLDILNNSKEGNENG